MATTQHTPAEQIYGLTIALQQFNDVPRSDEHVSVVGHTMEMYRLLSLTATVSRLGGLAKAAEIPEYREGIEARYQEETPQVLSRSEAKAQRLIGRMYPAFVRAMCGAGLIGRRFDTYANEPTTREAWDEFAATYFGASGAGRRDAYRKQLVDIAANRGNFFLPSE